MRILYSCILLWLGCTVIARAQQPASTITADTAGFRLNSFYTYYPGTLQLANGMQITGYMPVTTQYPGWDQPFGYYLSSPKASPRPKIQIGKVADVTSMSVAGRYYETMRVAGNKKPKILAERCAQGAVELFIQADPQRVPLPIPVAGAFVHTAIPYTSSKFFVRRNGELIEVQRDIFDKQMSAYLGDNKELAAKIARKEKGYHYRNLVGIITAYNEHAPAKATEPGK